MDKRYSKTHYFPFPQVHLAIWWQRTTIASLPFKDQSHLKQKMAKRETHAQTELMEGLKRTNLHCFSLSIHWLSDRLTLLKSDLQRSSTNNKNRERWKYPSPQARHNWSSLNKLSHALCLFAVSCTFTEIKTWRKANISGDLLLQMKVIAED